MSDEEKKETVQEPTFTPEQQAALSNMYARLASAINTRANGTVLDYSSFMQQAMLALASNSFFFSTNSLPDQEVIQRMLRVSASMWAALTPQPQQAQVPQQQVAQQQVPQQAIPQPVAAQAAAVMPTNGAQGVQPNPAYTPLPGFQGMAQQVSVGGIPNVHGQPVPMGPTVPTPLHGGVGSGVPAFQGSTPAGQKVQVIAENYGGQNLGPGQVPMAPIANRVQAVPAAQPMPPIVQPPPTQTGGQF